MDIRPHKEIKESRAVDFWEKKEKRKKKDYECFGRDF